MLKVGLTGGIGCGKSTAVNVFRELGIPIIDADLISRQLVKPGQAALQEIAEAFGEGILQVDGSLDRARLKSIVFNNEQQLRTLEAIMHPRVREEVLLQLSRAEQSGADYAIADIPLLTEANYQHVFDEVVVIDCSRETQITRVKARDNLADEVIEKIITQQISREERLQISTQRVNNDDSIENLNTQILALHKKFTAQNNR